MLLGYSHLPLYVENWEKVKGRFVFIKLPPVIPSWRTPCGCQYVYMVVESDVEKFGLIIGEKVGDWVCQHLVDLD